MRAVIQRVNSCTVRVEGRIIGEINKGLLVLLAIENEDNDTDLEWLSNKIVHMRIFSDEEGKMNLSVSDLKHDILVVSQFTLYGSTRKGNRPSFIRSANPDYAKTMYEKFVQNMSKLINKEVATGEFAAYMKIELENDGPVTIVIDSKLKE